MTGKIVKIFIIYRSISASYAEHLVISYCSETIFGYRDLKIKLYYSAGSLETYLGMTYTEKFNKQLAYEDVEPDEVLSKITPYLAPQIHDSLDSFTKALTKDEKFRPYGELLHAFTIDRTADFIEV